MKNVPLEGVWKFPEYFIPYMWSLWQVTKDYDIIKEKICFRILKAYVVWLWFTRYILHINNCALFPSHCYTLLFKYIQPCNELLNNLNTVVTVVVDEELQPIGFFFSFKYVLSSQCVILYNIPPLNLGPGNEGLTHGSPILEG